VLVKLVFVSFVVSSIYLRPRIVHCWPNFNLAIDIGGSLVKIVYFDRSTELTNSSYPAGRLELDSMSSTSLCDLIDCANI